MSFSIRARFSVGALLFAVAVVAVNCWVLGLFFEKTFRWAEAFRTAFSLPESASSLCSTWH